jgi:hypothetical protein
VRLVGCPGFDAVEFDDSETLNAENADEGCERVGLDDGEQPTDEIKKVRSEAETSKTGRLGDGRVHELMEGYRHPVGQGRRLISPGVSSAPERDLTTCHLDIRSGACGTSQPLLRPQQLWPSKM